MPSLRRSFGGPDADTLQFVGWDSTADVGTGELFSSFGVTVNVPASEVPEIPVPDEGDCVSSASVVVDGIVVDLVSDSGAVIGAADTRVSRMSAGDTFAQQ